MGLTKLIILTRHGEREHLRKHSTSLSETYLADAHGGADLTSDGLENIAALGASMRQRYFGSDCKDRCLGKGVYVRQQASLTTLTRACTHAHALLPTLKQQEAAWV